MNAERITLDTNILIYAIDKNAKAKHRKAMEIMEDAMYQDCVLTLQSLSEFFAVATKKTKCHYKRPITK